MSVRMQVDDSEKSQKKKQLPVVNKHENGIGLKSLAEGWKVDENLIPAKQQINLEYLFMTNVIQTLVYSKSLFEMH